MPSGQPFTRLCQQLAQLNSESQRADLHLHTCHSDGAWTPAEVVQRAAQRGLGAIAVTDHDTCSAFPEARATAQRLAASLEIIAGVEITSEFHGKEIHLLGYFIDPNEPSLASALAGLREQRRERFRQMSLRLSRAGLKLDESVLQARIDSGHALGRRDLAAMLVRAGHVATVAEAFARFLRNDGSIALPKQGLPAEDAIALVRAAGGVTSWAHPPQSVELDQVRELRDLGLEAIEAVYPTFASTRSRRLQEIAQSLGLAISGGSDCHGPTPVSRAIGNCGIRLPELERLRQRATSRLSKMSDAT
jgi:predicted metal-dependent phosphoesterase TrpH